MLKAFVRSLKGSPTPELKILSPQLHKILSKGALSEKSVKSFILEIERGEKLDNALRKIITEVNLPQSEIELFEMELTKSKGIASVMVVQDFLNKHDILESLKLEALPKNPDELNILIKSNGNLKNTIQTFITLINKHKIKLSLITLSLATAGNYLFQAANNLSGCYRYQISPSGDYKLLCKVNDCSANSEINSSINKIFCDGPCLSGLCDENCVTRTNDKFKYVCVTLHWNDVLSIITKRFSNTLSNFFMQSLKYVFIILIVFCVYSCSSNLNLFYRVAISIIILAILVIKFI